MSSTQQPNTEKKSKAKKQFKQKTPAAAAEEVEDPYAAIREVLSPEDFQIFLLGKKKETAKKVSAEELAKQKEEYESSSGLKEIRLRIKEDMAKVKELEEAKPELYKKGRGANPMNEEQKEKRAAQNKAHTTRNIFCKYGDGENGELEFKHGGKKITGCKYCCRNAETMKKHEKSCKYTKRVSQNKDHTEMNLTGEKSYYGMHDAPGGNQNPNSFMNGSTPISIGDEKQFRLPWSFINPTIESKFLEKGFIDENGYKKHIDIKKVREILIEYREATEITESPEFLEKNIDYLIKSPQRLRQAYMSLTTKKCDLIYIRGKTSFLEEGWLFEIQDSKKINYIQQAHLYGSSLISTKTFKAIKKIPDEVYRSIYGRRASMWELNETEITQLLN